MNRSLGVGCLARSRDASRASGSLIGILVPETRHQNARGRATPSWRSLTSRHQQNYVCCVRTTLTLDDDVAATLERLRKTREQNLEDLVNEALRHGLEQMTTPSKRREPFRTSVADLGRCWIVDVDNVAEALAVSEGEPLP